MHISSLDGHCCSCSVEVLILEFSYLATVEGVSVFSTELSHIKLHDSASDLLVRGESDLDVSVLEFRMLDNVLNGIHDFCDTGLVICSEESCSVGGYECLALVHLEFREFANFEGKSRYSLQLDISAVIIFNYLRMDISS